jgi:hypothetical protein
VIDERKRASGVAEGVVRREWRPTPPPYATDRQIDALVYELYGLTDEEIKIVEGEVGT